MVKDRTMQLRQSASTKKKGSFRAAGEKKNDEEMYTFIKLKHQNLLCAYLFGAVTVLLARPDDDVFTSKALANPSTTASDAGLTSKQVVLNIQSSKAVITKTPKTKDHNELSDVFHKVREITELIESMKENIVLLKKVHVAMQQSPRIDASVQLAALHKQIEAPQTATELLKEVEKINIGGERQQRLLDDLRPLVCTKMNETRERGEELNEVIKASCGAARKKIKELNPSVKKDSKTPLTAVNRVRQTQQGLLIKMLQDAVEDYEKSLDAHKHFSESMIKKQLHIANVEVSDEELMAMLDSQDLAVFVQNYMKETNEAMQSLQDARDRHKEIIALEKNIEQLRDMMVEISVNIHQQGDVVDRIEYHIGNGIIMTERGQKKISKAHKLMQRARKKKICIAICLTSVIAILLLYMTLYITVNRGQ